MSTTLDWFREGGPIMLAYSLVGVAGIAVLVERIYVIVFRSKNNGRVFIERIIQLVRAGKVEDAIKAVRRDPRAALPDMGLLILRSRSRDEGDLHNVASTAALAVRSEVDASASIPADAGRSSRCCSAFSERFSDFATRCSSRARLRP